MAILKSSKSFAVKVAAFVAIGLLPACEGVPLETLEAKSGADASCRREVLPPVARSVEFPDAIKVLPDPAGIYAGLYSIGTTVADIGTFRTRNGTPPALVFTFHDWLSDADWASDAPHLRTFTDPLEDPVTTPLALAESLAADGRILAVTWAVQCCDWGSRSWWLGLRKSQVTIPRLIKGEYDEYVRTVARQIKGFGKPIMLTLFSEFNYQGTYTFGPDGDEGLINVADLCGQYGDPTWPDGPERIRDAFVHVIDLFRAEGVRNVTWFMYASSRYMDPTFQDSSEWLHPKFFYPGDAYMDWVGQSVYFADPAATTAVNDDASLVEPAILPGYNAWSEVTQRPMFLPEFGALGDASASRAAVIRDVMANYLPTLSRVKALTLADFYIAEVCCQVPRLGQTFPEEVEAWRESVTRNPLYLESAPRVGIAGQ